MAEQERPAAIWDKEGLQFGCGCWACTEIRRLRALISWIDGQLVDEAPHMTIREAINRWREDVNR